MDISGKFIELAHFLSKDEWPSVFSQIALTLGATFIVYLAIKSITTKVLNRTSTNNIAWDEILIKAIAKPLLFFIWVFASFICFDYINSLLKLNLHDKITLLQTLSIIAAIAWILSELVNQVEHYWLSQYKAKKSKLDPTSIGAIVKVMNIVVVVFTGLAVMQHLGFSVSALVAFMGGGGVVAGFAAKDFLANFFGAIIIYFDRPFKVGDWVASPDKNIEGTVEKISLRTTMIRTFDKRPLYVPNSFFNTISIQNPSRMTHRRINEKLSIRHDDYKVAHKIADEIEKMFRDDERIDKNQILFVTVESVNNVSIDILIYALTTVTAFTPFYKFKQEKMVEIMKIVHKNKAKFADVTKSTLMPDGTLA